MDEIRRLVRENPWATLVSDTADGLVASHYPVLLDESRDDVSLLTHVGRPDDVLLELGQRELLIVVQGPHGYISPGWYDATPAVPTWNFVTAHFTGVPEILDANENYRVLGELVDFFERHMPEPRRMEGLPGDAAYARRISSGTVGLRLTPTRITAKAKLSQDKPPAIVEQVITALEGDGYYARASLATEMRRAAQRG
jgi:transcriptional regulator